MLHARKGTMHEVGGQAGDMSLGQLGAPSEQRLLGHCSMESSCTWGDAESSRASAAAGVRPADDSTGVMQTTRSLPRPAPGQRPLGSVNQQHQTGASEKMGQRWQRYARTFASERYSYSTRVSMRGLTAHEGQHSEAKSSASHLDGSWWNGSEELKVVKTSEWSDGH